MKVHKRRSSSCGPVLAPIAVFLHAVIPCLLATPPILVAAGPPRSVLPRSASRGNRWWVNHQHVKAANQRPRPRHNRRGHHG
jgi:hypothetical protein